MSTYIQLSRPAPDNSVHVEDDVDAVVDTLTNGSPDTWEVFTMTDGRKCAVKPSEVVGIWEAAESA